MSASRLLRRRGRVAGGELGLGEAEQQRRIVLVEALEAGAIGGDGGRVVAAPRELRAEPRLGDDRVTDGGRRARMAQVAIGVDGALHAA